MFGFQTILMVSLHCSFLSLQDLIWEPIGKPLIPLDSLRAPDRAGVKMSFLDWIKFILFVGIPNIPAFIHSRPSVADKRVISVRTTCPCYCEVLLTRLFKFIDLLNEKKKYKKLGVVGRVLTHVSWTPTQTWYLIKFFRITRYCFGGSTAVRFAGTELIHSAVICHPGGCKISEVAAIRVPTSWACAEGTTQPSSYCTSTKFLWKRTFSGPNPNAWIAKQFLQGEKTKRDLLNTNSKTTKVGRRSWKLYLTLINAQEPLMGLPLVQIWMSPKSSWLMKKHSSKPLNGLIRHSFDLPWNS